MTERSWHPPSSITPQSPVPIPFPQLVLTVAKFGYRRVIRKAGVQRRRPFRVLSPVLATTCGRDASLVSRSRRVARDAVPAPALPTDAFLAKTLGRLGVSRRLGYRLLRPLNRSQPLHGSRSACGRDLRYFVAPKLAGCSPEGEPLHLVIHGRLDCLPFGSKI